MSPERYAEALGAAFGDRFEALELPAMVVRQGLREILVCVADGVLAVLEAVALHDALHVYESVLPDGIQGDRIGVANSGQSAERRILAYASERAGVGDAPRLATFAAMESDGRRIVQEDNQMRCGITVLLCLFDGNLAKGTEDVSEIGCQIVQYPCFEVELGNLRGREHAPCLLHRVPLLVKGHGDQQRAGLPDVGVAADLAIQLLGPERLQEQVALSRLLHRVLAVPAAAYGAVDLLACLLVLEDDHLLVAQPVQEPLLVPAILQMDPPVGEVGAELLAVVAPLAEPVPREARPAGSGGIRRGLIRDGGIPGITVHLGAPFAQIQVEKDKMICGAGAKVMDVARVAEKNNVSGFEFLCGIPGSVGGAVRMNAGAYGEQISDKLLELSVITPDGDLRTLTQEELRDSFQYRNCLFPTGWIFVGAVFQGKYVADSAVISERMALNRRKRENGQPMGARTAGSTFKNPEGTPAWQLIDKVGMRGARRGGAEVSQKHANFLINLGHATAKDIEMLGEEIRSKVYEKEGITLEWEIKKLGVDK